MNGLRGMASLAFVALVALLPARGHADVFELKNDGFVGGVAAYQSGFATGEVAASVFDPPGPFPMALNEIQLLFGTAQVQVPVNVYVWEDTGANNPGAEIYAGGFVLTGSGSAFSSINLSAQNVQVNGPFRIGFEFTHDGQPSVARDLDGTVDGTKNFIRANGIGWFPSTLFGVAGDWVIRAFVESGVSTAAPPDLVAAGQLMLAPNPFNPATQVSFDLPIAAAVTVRVYDVRGRQVDSLLEGVQLGAGPQQITYQTSLPSGVYFMAATSGAWSSVTKFTVAK